MAKNEAANPGRFITCTPTAGGALSGDPAILGQLPGVATHDAVSGVTTIDTKGVYTMLVGGINAGGNIAIAAGDQLYFTNTDSPKVNARIAGVKFGIALDPVTSGSTTTVIRVRLGAAG